MRALIAILPLTLAACSDAPRLLSASSDQVIITGASGLNLMPRLEEAQAMADQRCAEQGKRATLTGETVHRPDVFSTERAYVFLCVARPPR